MSYQGSQKECSIVPLLYCTAVFCIQSAFSLCFQVQSCPTYKSAWFLFWIQAPVRLRVKGEKAPELLLELQDDDRTQTFLTQVKSVQQQGKSGREWKNQHVMVDLL